MAEFISFFFGFFTFTADASHAAYFWMFIPHMLRAVLSLLIIKKIPTINEMVGNITINPGEKIPFHKIGKLAATGAKESFELFQNNVSKFLLIYTILTFVALTLDIIVLFVGAADMNSDVGAVGSVFITLLAFYYFLVAFYYLAWAFSVKMRMPDSVSGPALFCLLGLFKKMNTTLETND